MPNGFTNAEQVRAIADDRREFGTPFVDITTRQQIQIRGFGIEHVPEIWTSARSASGCCRCRPAWTTSATSSAVPLAGLTPRELFDASPVVREFTEHVRRQQGVHEPAAEVQRRHQRVHRALHACRVAGPGADAGREDGRRPDASRLQRRGRRQDGIGRLPDRVAARHLRRAERGGGALPRDRVAVPRPRIARGAQPRAALVSGRERGAPIGSGANWSSGWGGRSSVPGRMRAIQRRRRSHRHRPAEAGRPQLRRAARRRSVACPRASCAMSRASPSEYGNGDIRFTTSQNVIIPNVPTRSLPALAERAAAARAAARSAGRHARAGRLHRHRLLPLRADRNQGARASRPRDISRTRLPHGSASHHALVGMSGRLRQSRRRRHRPARQEHPDQRRDRRSRGRLHRRPGRPECEAGTKMLEDVPCDELPRVLEQLIPYISSKHKRRPAPPPVPAAAVSPRGHV